MAELSTNQGILLLLMIDEAERWWTAARAREVWPWPGKPRSIALGMALRGLWTRGLVERTHGPPATYRLTEAGRQTARTL